MKFESISRDVRHVMFVALNAARELYRGEEARLSGNENESVRRTALAGGLLRALEISRYKVTSDVWDIDVPQRIHQATVTAEDDQHHILATWNDTDKFACFFVDEELVEFEENECGISFARPA